MSEIEARDEVGSTDNVVRVEKTKCVIFEGRYELDPVQPLGFPPRSVRLIDLEPTDPEDIHPFFVRHCWSMENVHSEDAENSCVCVWVSSILRKGHDMRSVPHVHPVLAAP